MLLDAFSILYGAGVGFNRLLYKTGFKKTAVFPAFVISVGNITAGGAGKTSFVMKVCEILKDKNPAVVTRGYKGKEKGPIVVSSEKDAAEKFGDEPVMMSRHLKNIPVIVSKKRSEGVKFAVEQLKKDTIILDDAFQNFSVKKDREIVIIDVLKPRGKFMRERFSSIKRANAVFISRANLTGREKLKKLNAKLSKYGVPVFAANLEISEICDIKTGEKYDIEKIKNQKIAAFCGIGNPESFRTLLVENGINPRKFLKFPDHYSYKKSDIEKLDPDFIWLATEKDAVKLRNIPPNKKIFRVETVIKTDDRIKNLFL
ncbi:MAG: tetraacyldisaccharide 4'-kinase [Elusimicrobia bacterium]|nr:tetraacyldisaccharide 4'-kinase [Elusimicrobiota bacterium]